MMLSVHNLADQWLRLTMAGLVALALAIVPFHTVLAMAPASDPGAHEVATVEMHHHGSMKPHHAARPAPATAHAPCGMSACGIATLPGPIAFAVRAALHIDRAFSTDSGRAQLAAAPEQPPPRP